MGLAVKRSPGNRSIGAGANVRFRRKGVYFARGCVDGDSGCAARPAGAMRPGDLLLYIETPIKSMGVAPEGVYVNEKLYNVIPVRNSLTFFCCLFLDLGSSFSSGTAKSAFGTVSKSVVGRRRVVLPPLARRRQVITQVRRLFTALSDVRTTLTWCDFFYPGP